LKVKEDSGKSKSFVILRKLETEVEASISVLLFLKPTQIVSPSFQDKSFVFVFLKPRPLPDLLERVNPDNK
jgi:hypothetical protein